MPPEFATDALRQALWLALLKKNEMEAVPLPDVIILLGARLLPVLTQAAPA